jgi:hypothetical protein
MIKTIRFSFFLLAFTIAAGVSSWAQGNPNVEANFIAMLKNATLKGTWAPVQQGQSGAAKADEGYRIARVEKKEGDNWVLVSLVNYQGKEIEYPFPAVVKFAGDTAVLILNDVRTGRDAAKWSARVLFHDNVYAGRWWETANRDHAGTIAGTITQAK